MLRARDEIGLNGIGFTIYSLPADPKGRIDYLQMIAEEIVSKVSTPEPIYGQVSQEGSRDARPPTDGTILA